MNRFMLILLFFTLCISLNAEQITTVGVVNVSTVFNSYYQDSNAVRELEELKVSIQQQIDDFLAELRSLEEQKREAELAGDEAQALRIDDEVFEKTQYIQDFTTIKQRQLYDMEQRLLTSDSFLADLRQAIVKVAEANGFTIVVTANDNQLIWHSQEVDITNLVLEQLRTTR
jgi:outer membrane protein